MPTTGLVGPGRFPLASRRAPSTSPASANRCASSAHGGRPLFVGLRFCRKGGVSIPFDSSGPPTPPIPTTGLAGWVGGICLGTPPMPPAGLVCWGGGICPPMPPIPTTGLVGWVGRGALRCLPEGGNGVPPPGTGPRIGASDNLAGRLGGLGL